MDSKKTYFAMADNYSFSIPALNEKGEKVSVMNSYGQPMIGLDGQPIPRMLSRNFTTMPDKSDKRLGNGIGLSVYVTQDPLEMKVLDSLCDDAQTPVMSFEAYEKLRNAEAFGIKQELEQERKDKASLQDKLADAEKRIAMLEGNRAIKKGN